MGDRLGIPGAVSFLLLISRGRCSIKEGGQWEWSGVQWTHLWPIAASSTFLEISNEGKNSPYVRKRLQTFFTSLNTIAAFGIVAYGHTTLNTPDLV